MKKEKEITKSYKTTLVESVTCDLCGVENNDANTFCQTVNWASDTYAKEEVGVFIAEGNVYPEGGYKEVIEFHICPKCFKDKVIPWLKENGASPTKYDQDY